MGHSYSSSLFHIVFSTKDRHKNLDATVRERLFPYLGGIARENGMQLLAAGGVEDHVHCLVVIPASLALAKAVQLLKGVSSKWVHETFPLQSHFAWQEGYGAFSISVSGIEDTIAYIRNQQEHHRTRTFEEEFIAFLDHHKLEFDQRYVFG